jgi:hypothetical protein
MKTSLKWKINLTWPFYKLHINQMKLKIECQNFVKLCLEGSQSWLHMRSKVTVVSLPPLWISQQCAVCSRIRFPHKKVFQIICKNIQKS